MDVPFANRVTYDPIGQLQSAFGFLSGGGGPDSLETKGYKYDAAQNLNVRTNNGATTSFSVNVKNELTGSYTYDSNGNLATDFNARTYTYDAENRLTQIVGYNYTFRHDFTYDGFSRLRARHTYVWNGVQWNFQSAIKYIYDGWNVIQERDYGNTPTVTYTRGPDLSGSLQGAGGIGGMLARSSGYYMGSWSAHHAYHADGGGNITAMVNTAQALSANYRYDAFGNLISSSGGMASANTYRFSSKEWMPDAALYYYGYRFYSPNYQRWINQDPIGELGGINLYRFVRNNPVEFADPLGLSVKETCKKFALDAITACTLAWNCITGEPDPTDKVPPPTYERKLEDEDNKSTGRRDNRNKRPGGPDPKPKGPKIHYPPRYPVPEPLPPSPRLRIPLLGVAANVLGWIPGLLRDLETLLRARESGRSFPDQVEYDSKLCEA
jgi:RHS repeat-associated protein